MGLHSKMCNIIPNQIHTHTLLKLKMNTDTSSQILISIHTKLLATIDLRGFF